MLEANIHVAKGTPAGVAEVQLDTVESVVENVTLNANSKSPKLNPVFRQGARRRVLEVADTRRIVRESQRLQMHPPKGLRGRSGEHLRLIMGRFDQLFDAGS